MSRHGASGIHDRPGTVEAVDGVVIIDGPAALAVTLTPGAAAAMSRRLAVCASKAMSQGRPPLGSKRPD